MVSKFMRALRMVHGEQKGITGLETAIILIAFVTVASVLGYSVLSAGIFSAEKGKQTVYQGLSQAQASMQVKGSVFANSTDNSTISTVTFVVASVLNDENVDMTPPGTGTHLNTTIINYTDSSGTTQDVSWDATALGTKTGTETEGYMLQPNEQMLITVTLPNPNALATYSTFSLQISPSKGAAITIQRTLPGILSASMDLN